MKTIILAFFVLSLDTASASTLTESEALATRYNCNFAVLESISPGYCSIHLEFSDELMFVSWVSTEKARCTGLGDTWTFKFNSPAKNDADFVRSMSTNGQNVLANKAYLTADCGLVITDGTQFLKFKPKRERKTWWPF